MPWRRARFDSVNTSAAASKSESSPRRTRTATPEGRSLTCASARECHPNDCTYADRAERAIVGFYLDAQGRVGRRARLRPSAARAPPAAVPPPAMGSRGEGRQQRLGTRLECRPCDQNVHAPARAPDAAGEAACLAHLVCPDCGVVPDGSRHGPGCASVV